MELSYEMLRELLRKEMKSGALTPLPKDFYEKLSDFINGIGEEKLRKNAMETAKQIYERRMAKLLIRAAHGGGGLPEELPDLERAFFKEVDGRIRRFRERMESTMKKEERVEKKEDIHGSQLRVLQDVPQFVGPDGSIYGPFKKGEVAWLPETIADLLIKKKVAERF